MHTLYPEAPSANRMQRRYTFQSVAWFWDLYRRNLLNLDPPYQRRSVWNQSFKDFFIDTVLLGYPAPSIFLFESIAPTGLQRFSVVDGKQRLTTIFDFLDNAFPISESATLTRTRGLYFKDLDDNLKTAV